MSSGVIPAIQTTAINANRSRGLTLLPALQPPSDPQRDEMRKERALSGIYSIAVFPDG
jgi:hypothetical protein